jgi:hypothetical protein
LIAFDFKLQRPVFFSISIKKIHLKKIDRTLTRRFGRSLLAKIRTAGVALRLGLLRYKSHIAGPFPE